jgi:hypothetical protein
MIEPTDEGEIVLDAFRPNYSARCENCGQSPTVEGVKDGKVVYSSDMCGPCTFGKAACLDPEEWNK